MESSEANSVEDTPPRRRRLAPQWSLKTMLLLTAVIAAWIPYIRFRHQIAESERQIASMRQMTRELIVEDPTQIAVVKLPQMWRDENQWEIYLPEGDYRMRLATREVDKEGFPPATEQSLLSAGKHRIELLQSEIEDCWKITIMVDDHPSIEAVESPDWPPNHSSSSANLVSNWTQLSPDEAVILFRRRYRYPTGNGSSNTPQGPTEGLMLWIERIAE